MALDREGRAAELDSFAAAGFAAPKVIRPVGKPLDVHVARAAENALTLNVVNLNYEIRKIVVAQGIQFHTADKENAFKLDPTRDDPAEVTIPASLKEDFPDLVIRSAKSAVFISDAQHVEFHIDVVDTKDAFKQALETPGIHVIYCGHSRYGRGPCFGPDLTMSLGANKELVRDLTGENWETGTDPVKFGLFRMGHPFVGVAFDELDEHQYKIRPVPATVTVNPGDIDPLVVPGSLKPIALRGTRFEPFIADPAVDRYWGCRATHGGEAVLLFAGFANTGTPTGSTPPMDLGATDLKCRCLTILSCDSFKHFRDVVRRRKGFTRTATEGFAYFVQDLYFSFFDRLYIGSLFEYDKRNDHQSWFDCLEFAVKRTNQKLAAANAKYSII